MNFENIDFWKAIILYGLNSATYKIALGKSLIELSSYQNQNISWEVLSESFLKQYIIRLETSNMPQQANPSRLTVMERIVKNYSTQKIDYDEAICLVSSTGLNDVIPRFQTIGKDKSLIGNKFYDYDFGKHLDLHDPLFEITENNSVELNEELESRWSLLEGAFRIKSDNWELSNNIRDIYISKGYQRTSLTNNIPFLQGYQGNVCFYCGEVIPYDDIHVDHVLPRQIVNHDEVWNLVLSHGFCNMSKSDSLINEYYLEKLATRNENIMGSNHPWKLKIEKMLGDSPKKRKSNLLYHYHNVKKVLGLNYWGGIKGYVPESDPFYKKLITKLNNG